MAVDLDIVGSAAVDVVPIVPRFHRELRNTILPMADRVGLEAGRRLGDQLTDSLRTALAGDGQRIGDALGEALGDAAARRIAAAIPSAITQGGRAGQAAARRQGDSAGGAFARSLRGKLERAFRAMPRLDVGLADTGVDAELARIRAKLETLAGKTIGVDISAEDAEAEVVRLDERLRRLGASTTTVAVRADTATARAALAEVRAEISALTADPATIRVEADGQFATRLRAAVRQAEETLPTITLTADSTAADIQIARLRAQLTTLRDARIGIDIDAATATAQISAIATQLQALSASDADVAIRVDAGAAATQLAAVHAMVNRLDRDDVRIRVHANTGSAMASLMLLGATVAGVAAIPIAPLLVAGLGAIGAAGVAAGAGLGSIALVAIPAIKGVTSVLQAKKAAQEEASRATDNGAAAEQRAAQTALQMAGAQSALTSARRQGAQAAAQAARAVQDAERGVGDAVQRAAGQRRQGAETIRQAADTVRQAERSLSDAQRDARSAEEDLTRARADATRQLEEQQKALDERIRGSALDQRDAQLRVREAHAELQRVLADPTATDLQKDRATLAHDQAVEGLRDQKKEQVDLLRQQRAAKKERVEANEAVVSAAEAAADAERRVKDEARAVADAQTAAARAASDAAEAQVEAQEGIVEAQRAVADAVEQAAETQVESAERIEAAERGIDSARLSGVDTTTQAATATDKYQESLAKLTPSQRELYDAIAGPEGLSAAFSDWQTELQPDVLPIFTRGVDGAKNALPGLTTLVRNSAGAVSELQDDASKELKNPFWTRFKRGLEEAAAPAIEGFGKTFGNIFKGMAGVIDAFFPHMDGISGWMVDESGKFADWATKLKGSPEFEGFIRYVKENGPKVAGALGDIGGAFFEIAQALSPLSGPVLDVIGEMADGIGNMAEKAPWLVQGMWGLVAATAAWSFVMSMSPVGRIIWLVGLLAAGVIYAYEKFPIFREAVDTAWAAIKKGSEFLWTYVLEPFLTNFWRGLEEVGKWVKNLRDGLAEFFTWLGEILGWVWENVVWPFAAGWIQGYVLIGEGAQKLWEKTSEVWGWIGEKAGWLYEKGLKPPLDNIKTAIGLVADSFEDAKKSIRRSWHAVAAVVASPVNFIIDMVYTNGIKALWESVADSVGIKQKLPNAPKLVPESPKFLAQGGTVGAGWGVARPMVTNKPTAIVGEGNPRFPEFVLPTDPKYRGRALELWRQAGTQLLERGGILGSLDDAWDWTKEKATSVIGTGIDWAKTGADILANPGRIWDKLARPVVSRLTDGVGKSPVARIVAGVPKKIIGGLRDKLVSTVASMFAADGGGSGVWVKPVNVGYGTRFGVAGRMWSSGHHTGLDFPAPTGTLVRAVADGRVSSTANGGPYGRHLEIDHGGKLSSLYAHLSSITTGLNAAVKQGQAIGRVGATGNVTGPHLHLEARRGGRTVDPMPLLTTGGPRFTGDSEVAAQQYARAILGNYGWSDTQWPALKRLWEEESNWRWNARNPTSGAYGIPQSLPAEKMASAGSDWRTSYATQVRWGLDYIKNRPDYGSPSKAWQMWQSRSPHWYDDGGYLPPGLNLVANGTGKPEPVLTSQQWSDIRAAKAGGPTEIHADVTVYVGDREITDIVRTEVVARESATATSITTGRWT
ncbi:peptidoglycan DD-metalloendopeptidase family protein [Streptomyces uncialis]|uniref:aggregation-promoting factor C-terminal-like domain-containing protein n=1 Tax=Streptomyces uncialis TaxID=1048205 RepID=UPI0037FA7C5A